MTDQSLLELTQLGPRGAAFVMYRLVKEDSATWTKPCQVAMQKWKTAFGIEVMGEYAQLIKNEGFTYFH